MEVIWEKAWSMSEVKDLSQKKHILLIRKLYRVELLHLARNTHGQPGTRFQDIIELKIRTHQTVYA